jgi:hypothetical protein
LDITGYDVKNQKAENVDEIHVVVDAAITDEISRDVKKDVMDSCAAITMNPFPELKVKISDLRQTALKNHPVGNPINLH